jgi:competence protein ComFC
MILPSAFSSSIKRSFKTAVDLVYPRQCKLCGGSKRCDEFPFLCNDCFDSAKVIHPPCCQKCGLPFAGNAGEEARCANCSELGFEFDRAVSMFHFKGVVREAIHRFKYSHEEYWSKALIKWTLTAADGCLKPGEFDLVIPVPLYPVKFRERGFNQSGVLAEAIAKQWGAKYDSKALVRTRETETQVHLDRRERLENLKGAFGVRRGASLANLRVLLVDDVLTTGSTASECAAALREAGATSILVFTLARGY